MEVSDITSSKLPLLELIEKQEVERLLKGRNITGVPSKFFLSSDDVLRGYSFSRCQAVALIDGCVCVGALLHNHPQEDPSDYIYGNFSKKGKAIHLKGEGFGDCKLTDAFHVYHESNHSYPSIWIEHPLKKMGVRSIKHIPIKISQPGKNYRMDVILDVRDRKLYVIPTDFEKGLVLNI